MRLPRQTEVIHRLEFTPAEKYFYKQRSVYWIDQFRAGVENVQRDEQIFTLSKSVSMTSNYSFSNASVHRKKTLNLIFFNFLYNFVVYEQERYFLFKIDRLICCRYFLIEFFTRDILLRFFH